MSICFEKNDLDYINFSWRFYLEHHIDLKNAGLRSKDDAIRHFIHHGHKEWRKIHADPIFFPSFTKSKICVFYSYYERPYDKKNLTNLSFFIQYAIHEQWKINPEQLQIVILINGECSLNIQEYENIIVLRNTDVSSDFHAWDIGIKYMEKISQSFDYIVLMNCSCFGPVVWKETCDHWLLPFFQKLIKDKATACSPCISYLSKTFPEGEGPKIVSTFVFLRWAKEIRKLLMETLVSSIDESSINIHKFPDYHNTVLGVKKDKIDAILTGEYGISRILLKHGRKITCLLYPDIQDFDDPILFEMNEMNAPDRFETYFGKNLPFETTIFIKNIWRVGNEGSYNSIPVYYDKCIEFRNEVLNMKNIFNGIDNVDWNIEGIPSCKENGVHEKNPLYSWNTKTKYYEIYGKAEETVIFPFSKELRVALFYITNHSESLHSYVLDMIQTLKYLDYKIVLGFRELSPTPAYFENNVECIYNKNTSTDFWNDGRNYCKSYQSIMFLTDEILFPIHGVEKMKLWLENASTRNWFFCNNLFEEDLTNTEKAILPKFIPFFADEIKNSLENKSNPFVNYLKRHYIFRK